MPFGTTTPLEASGPQAHLVFVPSTSNPFGCSSIPPVPIWESATIWRLSNQDGCRMGEMPQTTCSEVESLVWRLRGGSLRPPVRRSSHLLVALKAGDARAWIDNPLPSRSKECEKGRAEVPGTFSARAHREDDKQYSACGCGGYALRAGRRLLAASVTLRSAPYTKRT